MRTAGRNVSPNVAALQSLPTAGATTGVGCLNTTANAVW